MQAILETLRPKQWIKNLVIFAGLVFDGQLLNLQPFLRVLFATLIFCLISGLTYTLNDLFDIKADRLHPQKKNRPNCVWTSKCSACNPFGCYFMR